MEQMEVMQPTSMLALFDTTKEQRASFVERTIQSIKEGEADPLRTLVHVKNVEQLCKMLTESKEFKTLALAEAEKYGKKFERFNANVAISEVGVKYDYTTCSDPEYDKLFAACEDAKAKLKEREKFLQNIPEKGFEVVDQESGEAYMIYRPAKSSTTNANITLK